MAEVSPFQPRTTAAIERADRLLAFRDSPAYNEVFRTSMELVDEARAAQRNFRGWDSQQIVTLAIRVQVAEQFHEALFGRMSAAIDKGIEEAKAAMTGMDTSDALRDKILSRFEDDPRVAGSH